MTHAIRQILIGLALIVTLPLLAAEAWGQQQTQPEQPHAHPLAGAIASVSDGSFVLTERGGQSVTVHTTSATRIIGRQRATLSDIRTGDAVRIIATKGTDGSLTARAVQDMGSGSQTPERARGGVRETNSGMVIIGGKVTGSPAGGVLTVASPDGQTTSVTVPQTARVSRLGSMPASSLAPGTHVFVRGTSNADGSVTAAVIFVAGTTGK